MAIAVLAASATICPTSLSAKIYGDTIYIPERAFVLTGNPEGLGSRNIAVLYSREGLAFDEPSAPRFLFLDREGKVALGIGGYVKALGSFDFDGAINSPAFTTCNIPVPTNPAQRQRFGADVSHSRLFLKLVAHNSRFGLITAYIQTQFTGDNGGYGLMLREAYINVGHLTAGLDNSTFVDGESQAPTIDPQGPAGQISARNMLFRYKFGIAKGWTAAISAEVPTATYTTVANRSEAIAQRFPDIPAYIQYSWASGCHLRASALLRQLSYRNLVTSENHLKTGWGVQLSGVGDIVGGLGFFGHIAYGKGISRYINDLAGSDLDLVPGTDDGSLKAPGALAWTAGLSYHFTRKFFATADFSINRIYNVSQLSSDTYKSARYFAINAFYDLTGEFRLGAEYVHGRRGDISGKSGHANRIEAMVQYSF